MERNGLTGRVVPREVRRTEGYRLLRDHTDGSARTGDVWGACLGAWFDVCDELERRGAWIPPEWVYWPGLSGPAPRSESSFHGLVGWPDAVTDGDLQAFGWTLQRWARRIEYRGEDY